LLATAFNKENTIRWCLACADWWFVRLAGHWGFGMLTPHRRVDSLGPFCHDLTCKMPGVQQTPLSAVHRCPPRGPYLREGRRAPCPGKGRRRACGWNVQQPNASTRWGVLQPGPIDTCPLAILGRHGGHEWTQCYPKANWGHWILNRVGASLYGCLMT